MFHLINFLLAISRTLNSLFKVLFIFPSRYLFAIGINVIFNLRISLYSSSSCVFKQLYSLNTATCCAYYNGSDRAVTFYSKFIPNDSPSVATSCCVSTLQFKMHFNTLISNFGFSCFTRRY